MDVAASRAHPVRLHRQHRSYLSSLRSYIGRFDACLMGSRPDVGRRKIDKTLLSTGTAWRTRLAPARVLAAHRVIHHHHRHHHPAAVRPL